MAILVGRAGSGKSRMAAEWARHLARRDILGRPMSAAKLKYMIGAYLRHILPGLRRQSDPWDAGLLIGSGEFDQTRAQIKDWRPRRPTLLVLDDPSSGWTSGIWQALHEAASKKAFVYPVCLLVTNQTVPVDARFEFDPTRHSWTCDGSLVEQPPITLPPTAWFTDEETRIVAFKSGFLAGKPENINRYIREELHRVTDGNPLLVQLAIEYLRDREDVGTVNTSHLTSIRAQRILTQLRDRGFRSDDQLAALALATLVGGALRTRIEAAVYRLYGRPFQLPSYVDLKACFPAEPLTPGGAMRIIPVRPELVGDAFIECVLTHIGAEQARALVETGFRLDAAAMVRNIERVSSQQSAIGEAMLSVDPFRIEGLQVIEVAVAFAELAAIFLMQAAFPPKPEARLRALALTLNLIGQMDERQNAAFCSELVSRLGPIEDPFRKRSVAPKTIMRLINAAAGRTSLISGEVLIRLFSTLRRISRNAVDQPSGETSLIPSVLAITSFSVLNDFITAIANFSAPLISALRPLWLALLEKEDQFPKLVVLRLRFFSLIDDPKAARRASQELVALTTHHTAAFEMQRIAVQAKFIEAACWLSVPEGRKAKAVERAASEAVSIASQYPEHAGVYEYVVGARRNEVYAWSQVPLGAQAAAAQRAADATAAAGARFLDDVCVQEHVAGARRYEAYAWSQVPSGKQAEATRSAANSVVALAAHFPDDQSIQEYAAGARQHEAYAWSEVPSGARAAEARNAADAVVAIAAHFPDDEELQENAAAARRHEASAWSKVPSGEQAAAARSAADAVFAIAARFPNNEKIQERAAYARRFEVDAWSKASSQAAAARRAADSLTVIMERFPDNANIKKEVAWARHQEAHAWAVVPLGEEAIGARRAADALAAIAESLPGDANLQQQSACARRHEAYAWSEVAFGGGAGAARQAAEAVANIAIRFPYHVNIQQHAARARRHEAYAWSSVPYGGQAAAAQQAADAANEIARLFPDDVDIQRYAAGARCSEAWAWAAIPSRARAVSAKQAADAALSIAARFLDDADIQATAENARSIAREVAEIA